MGQFEYSVGLSPVKPSEIAQLAIDYLNKKEREDMVKHEFGMLVLDKAMSKADQDAINSFIGEQIQKERYRILDELEQEALGYSNLNIAKFKLRQIINNTKEIF